MGVGDVVGVGRGGAGADHFVQLILDGVMWSRASSYLSPLMKGRGNDPFKSSLCDPLLWDLHCNALPRS